MPSFWSEHHGNLVIAPEPSTTDTIRTYGKKRPNALSEVSYTSATTKIAFVHSDTVADTITDADNKFVTEGFKAGDVVRISDSDSNDLEVLVATVVAGTLTLHTRELLTTEAASAIAITITTVTHFEEEYEDVLQAMAAYRIAKDFGLPNANEIRDTYREYLGDVWPGMDYKPQSIRVGYRRF